MLHVSHFFKSNPLGITVTTERLISYRSAAELDIAITPSVDPIGNQFSTVYGENTMPPIPPELRRTIKVKNGQDLGMELDEIGGGVNGAIVAGLSKEGVIARDGRIRVGDFIVSVNGESLRQKQAPELKSITSRARDQREIA